MKEKIMRKTALILIMLTLWGISANLVDQEVRGEDGGEVIDSILSDTEIVIADVTYRIDPEAVFLAADGDTLIEFREFKAGDQVELTLNSSGAIIELTKSTGQ